MSIGSIASWSCLVLVFAAGCTSETQNNYNVRDTGTGGRNQVGAGGSNVAQGASPSVGAGRSGLGGSGAGGSASSSTNPSGNAGAAAGGASNSSGGAVGVGGQGTGTAGASAAGNQGGTASGGTNTGVTAGAGVSTGGTATGGQSTAGAAAVAGRSSGGASAGGGTATGGSAGATGGAPMCTEVGTGWSGCRGTACHACSSVETQYPLYFVHRPGCIRNDACDAFGRWPCGTACSEPVADDADSNCAPAASVAWPICTKSGCTACAHWLQGFARYAANHPSCKIESNCTDTGVVPSTSLLQCGANCPTPTDADREFDSCAGASGGWEHCRGSGCAVCGEDVADYPNYFKNHPNCSRNWNCGNVRGACSSHCPAPTEADR